MISAAACAVSARLSGSAFVATSLVRTSPYLFAPQVFWQKSTRSACNLSFDPGRRLPQAPAWVQGPASPHHCAHLDRSRRRRSAISNPSRPYGLLLLKFLHPLLQLLHHAPQHHAKFLIIETHQLPTIQILRFAHRRTQLPAGLHVLGHEPICSLPPSMRSKELWLHGIKVLQLLVRNGPEVLFERSVAQIDKPIPEDPLPIVAAPRLDSMARLARPLVVLKLMNWNWALSSQLPLASTLSSATPA